MFPVASAGAIDVTYTVSGLPGAWNLNFNVANNMTAFPFQDIYQFGVSLSSSNITGSPGTFLPDSSFWTNIPYGGSSVIYNNTWYDSSFAGLFPGTSLPGFIVSITDLQAPTLVSWFAFSVTTSFDPADSYVGNDAFYNDPNFGNAGFEGIATEAATSAPEPSTWGAVSGALVALAFLRRRFVQR